MTEQTVREQVADMLSDISKASERVLHLEENVDIILTIIRTALLSEPAVDAAAYQMDVTFGESYSLSAARDVISAAWDSVMGEGSE